MVLDRQRWIEPTRRALWRVTQRAIGALPLMSRLAAADPMPAGPAPVTPAASPPSSSMSPMPMHSPHGHSGLSMESVYRSPGLAVALSLTPVPVDFGNLYSENLGWGVAYTAVELSLMTPMMWVAGGHMGHGASVARPWSNAERNGMIGLVAGYVLVKMMAGIHAGYAAGDFNEDHADSGSANLEFLRGGALGQFQACF